MTTIFWVLIALIVIFNTMTLVNVFKIHRYNKKTLENIRKMRRKP